VLGGDERGGGGRGSLAVELERRQRVLGERRLAQCQERDQRRQERGAGQHTVQRPRDQDGTRPPAPAARLSRHGSGGYSTRNGGLNFAIMTGEATIMLVDDEESIQKLLTYPLERDGYRQFTKCGVLGLLDDYLDT
jgi:hypothetical protein